MLRDKWYVFDDSRVSPCDDSSVVVHAHEGPAHCRLVLDIFYGIRGVISFKCTLKGIASAFDWIDVFYACALRYLGEMECRYAIELTMSLHC